MKAPPKPKIRENPKTLAKSKFLPVPPVDTEEVRKNAQRQHDGKVEAHEEGDAFEHSYKLLIKTIRARIGMGTEMPITMHTPKSYSIEWLDVGTKDR